MWQYKVMDVMFQKDPHMTLEKDKIEKMIEAELQKINRFIC